LVIDGDTPDIADDAASALARELRKHPDLFGEVYDLAGDPYFRKNGLLYLEADELYELSDRLAEAQPFLGVLWRDPSLRGFFDMLGLAIDEALKSDTDGPIEIKAVLKAIGDVAEAQASGRFGNLSWQELMSGRPAGKDETRRFLLIQPALDFASLQPAAKTMTALRRLANDLKLDEQHGVRVRLTGSAALDHEELESVEEGMGLAAVLSLFLVIGLLLTGLGSPRLAASILVTLIVGLIWTAGFGVAALGQFNLISVAFAVLFIGLSVDFGIHFGLRYKEEIDRGHEHERALGETGTGVGGALALCAVTAAIGFYSFLPTAYLGLAELGLIAGTGMFIALFTNITVLPALLTLVTLRPASSNGKRGRGSAVQPFIADHATSIVWGALAVGLASLALVPQVRFDFDPMNLRNQKTESVSTLLDLMENSRNGPYSITILVNDLAAARELGGKLAALDPVDTTVTLFDYVPGNQDEKLEIIGSMALFLAPSLSATDHPPAPTAAQRRKAVENLRGRLERLSRSSRDGAAAARGLMTKLAALTASDSTVDGSLVELETRLLVNLPGRLDMLRQSLEAEPVGVGDLPESLRQRSVTADGRARLEVFPRENLQDGMALRRFVEAVRTLAPNATGAPVIILEAGRAVVAAFRDAAIIAVVCISLLLVLLLRSRRDVLLVFAPLTLAALMTIAATVVLQLPFNFANVIVLPLLFGLGVASGIHIVLRERMEQGTNGALATSTPRAVVFSALTTIGSFASIALSSHPGTASMGVLLAVAISLTLACTLVVLPALLAIVRPEPGDEEGEPP
jgi:hopanoid biosynthesis associated RND transporter like protein HpnN